VFHEGRVQSRTWIARRQVLLVNGQKRLSALVDFHSKDMPVKNSSIIPCSKQLFSPARPRVVQISD
jgi:hypothetical protein